MHKQKPKTSYNIFFDNEKIALTLLMGQSFFLGFAFALFYSSVNTLFLTNFPSEKLSLIYISIGIVVPIASLIFNSLQKIWPLSKVSILTVLFFTLMYFISWGILFFPQNTKWIAFTLMVCNTLGMLLCTIVRGAQAGNIFDARKLKQLYPIIIAGQVLAIIIGGLSVTPLISFLKDIKHLLLLSGFSMMIALVFLIITTRVFSNQLSHKIINRRAPGTTFRLFKKKYILLILFYQILSTIGTLLADYLYLSQAKLTFLNPESMSQFFGYFMAIITFVTLIFVIFISGKLLIKFGISLGLAGNPIGVGIAVIGAFVVIKFFRINENIFFFMILLAFAFDYILTTGLTDTTIQSTYQPLEKRERTTVHTFIEGIGIPIAYGITGITLLIINNIKNITVIHVVLLTIFICLIWIFISILLYLEYKRVLKMKMKRRNLDNTDFIFRDKSSINVINKLIKSNNEKEVILALDIIEKSNVNKLKINLFKLIYHENESIRINALKKIEEHKIDDALPEIKKMIINEENNVIKGYLLRCICALSSEPIEEVSMYLKDENKHIKLAVIIGLLKYSGIDGVLKVGNYLNTLSESKNINERIFLAEILGEVGIYNFYQLLIPLLNDKSIEVRKNAIYSAGNIKHPRLWPYVIKNLNNIATRSVAISVLSHAKEDLLSTINNALNYETIYDKDTIIRLIRICKNIRGSNVIKILKNHINHPDNEIQQEILTTLHLCGYQANYDDWNFIENVLLNKQIKHAVEVLLVQEEITKSDETAILYHALIDEYYFCLKRIFLLLSFLYEPKSLMGCYRKLVSKIKEQRALSIELLDLILNKKHKKTILLLIDENISIAKRTSQLKHKFNLKNTNIQNRLFNIINDKKTWTETWIKACAIYIVGILDIKGLLDTIVSFTKEKNILLKETAIWTLSKISAEKYKEKLKELKKDKDDKIIKLLKQI